MTIQTFTAGQRLTALQLNTLQASDFNFTRNVRNDLTYTFALSDKGKLVESTNAGAAVFTIANDSSVEFAVGDRIDVLLASVGSITIAAASGVTLYAEGDITTVASAWTRLTLIKRAENSWVMTGTGMSVQTVELDDLAVTTAKIANLNVTTGKIADDAVNGDKIADSSVTSAHIVDGTIVNGDVSASAAIAYSKLNLGTSIVNADIGSSAAIAYSKLNLGTSIVNGDVSASAGIVDTKLATISTALKVSNSATTATDANTASAIVARDSSGNFSAGTITANLTGIATYTAEWILGANGSSHYTFTGPGFTGAEDDPILHLVRGQKYKFTNTMGAHPFRIQSTVNGSTGTAYNDGITNNDVSNGTLIWDVQFDAPTVLYYQCTAHGTMGGAIYIVNETASMIGTRTVFVQQATPTANATGDIWFQVTGL